MRKRIRNSHFKDMTCKEQVDYAIEHWKDEIWTPVNNEVENEMSIDSCEYRDYYFMPQILEEVKGTEYERYIPEIMCGYTFFKSGF